MLRAGDKCPNCHEGLLERTTTGFACTQCDFSETVEEIVAANERMAVSAGNYVYKARTFKITIETPDEGEEFLRGLILAKQNNNSPYFADLIDAVNAVLEPYREAKLKQELAARG